MCLHVFNPSHQRTPFSFIQLSLLSLLAQLRSTIRDFLLSSGHLKGKRVRCLTLLFGWTLVPSVSEQKCTSYKQLFQDIVASHQICELLTRHKNKRENLSTGNSVNQQAPQRENANLRERACLFNIWGCFRPKQFRYELRSSSETFEGKHATAWNHRHSYENNSNPS